jgi:hypothetical protein
MSDPMYVFEIQASEQRDQILNGEVVNRVYPGYANLTAFVIAPTLERALELMRAEHPEMRTHQAIRRNQSRNLIVDPKLYEPFTQRNAIGEIMFQAEP